MMNKILWHAVSLGVDVHADPSQDAAVVKTIASGTWFGVLNEIDNWAFVIGKECSGWVLKTNIAPAELKTLHIMHRNSHQIGYSAQVKKVA